ncbi:MAG: hypothetical protein ACYS8Z_00110 [Planctomycetota bacterium]|jgi:hypothetical protein
MGSSLRIRVGIFLGILFAFTSSELPAAPAAPTDLNVVLLPGQVHVTWQDNSSAEYGFKLEMKLNALPTWSEVAMLGPNMTSYQRSASKFNTYRFRVRAFDEFGHSAYSNEDSVYYAPNITFLVGVTSPDGGEELGAGTVYPIFWWMSGLTGTSFVDIDYSVDGGSNFSSIKSGYPNTGVYYWETPDEITDHCVVRVRAAGTNHYDLSKQPFSIAGYDFDHHSGITGPQGWTLSPAYDANPAHAGFQLPDTDFMFNWKDDVEHPNPPGSDPAGDRQGSIALIKNTHDAIPRWHDHKSEMWYVDFISPPLQNLNYWQNAIGCRARIANCMETTQEMYCNIMLKLYDHDGGEYRTFTEPLNATLLEYCELGEDDIWNYRSFAWDVKPGFPVDNYTVHEIRVRIWGPLAYSLHGGVYLDDVTPIRRKGDFNSDGAVDFADYDALCTAIPTADTDPTWNPIFNLNQSLHEVDMMDLYNFSKYCWLEGAD